MSKKLSLDSVISQLRDSSMKKVVETGRIKGGLRAAAVHEGCHASGMDAAPAAL